MLKIEKDLVEKTITPENINFNHGPQRNVKLHTPSYTRDGVLSYYSHNDPET